MSHETPVRLAWTILTRYRIQWKLNPPFASICDWVWVLLYRQQKQHETTTLFDSHHLHPFCNWLCRCLLPLADQSRPEEDIAKDWANIEQQRAFRNSVKRTGLLLERFIKPQKRRSRLRKSVLTPLHFKSSLASGRTYQRWKRFVLRGWWCVFYTVRKTRWTMVSKWSRAITKWKRGPAF